MKIIVDCRDVDRTKIFISVICKSSFQWRFIDLFEIRTIDFLPSLAMEASEDSASPPFEMAEMSEENGSATVAPEAPVDLDPSSFSMPLAGEDEEGELPADFERLWKTTQDNPHDFTCWTDLLQYCEQEVC